MVEVWKNNELITFGELLKEDSRTFIIHSSSITYNKTEFHYKRKV